MRKLPENEAVLEAIAITTVLSLKQVKQLFKITDSYDVILLIYEISMEHNIDIFKIATEYKIK